MLRVQCLAQFGKVLRDRCTARFDAVDDAPYGSNDLDEVVERNADQKDEQDDAYRGDQKEDICVQCFGHGPSIPHH